MRLLSLAFVLLWAPLEQEEPYFGWPTKIDPA